MLAPSKLLGKGRMDDAEIVDQVDGYWVVVSHGRRYFLSESQFSNKHDPHVGQRGWLGYVQRPASRLLMFTDSEAAS